MASITISTIADGKPEHLDVNMGSPLLALPLELRTMIYTYILVHPLEQIASLVSYGAYMDPFNGRNYPVIRHRFCANILKTCKQINQEATPILYGENLFSCHPSLLAELPSLLLVSRPVHIVLPPVLYTHLTCHIRRFYMLLRLDTDPGFDHQKVELSFSGADEVRLEVTQSMYGGSDFSVLKMFEGVRGVRKATVYGSVGGGLYAQWLATAMMSPVGAIIDPYIAPEPSPYAWNSWSDGNR